MNAPRGICPVCRTRVRLTDGHLRMHASGRDWTPPQDSRERICAGSGHVTRTLATA